MHEPHTSAASGSDMVTVLMNCASGTGDKEQIRQQIRDALERGGRRVDIIDLGLRHQSLCEEAIARAGKSSAIVAAAGGDGTVNMVAELCQKHKVPLGVIPLGTFNYFARELGIPLDPGEAALNLVEGIVRNVSVGRVNGRLFLNNASFGLYTHIIRRREETNARFGRFRPLAALSAVATLLQGQRPFLVRMSTDGHQDLHRTSMVFVGRNALQLDNLNLDVARCIREDRLAVIVLKAFSPWHRLRVVLKSVIRRLNDEERMTSFCADSFSVESRKSGIDVAVDGEVFRCRPPLSFTVEPHALQVIVPARTLET
jgi:diacylglycerol kinase family enzyme